MQVLVYTFIALSALGVGCTAYYALTFTPAEAIMAGLTFAAVAIILLERTLRQRVIGGAADAQRRQRDECIDQYLHERSAIA